jgi:sialic acid synthase SpsE
MVKIILECCYNHQGDIKLAKKMIREAQELGVWGIKFQHWDYENMPEWKKNQIRKPENSFGDTYYEHRKALEFSVEELIELKNYAEKRNLVFICSGKDYNSVVDLVEKVECKYIKLPSQRYLDNKIFKYLVRNKHKLNKIMVSTGMWSEKEILSSKWLIYADVIMHCISSYPAKYEDVNFGWFRSNRFYNGYSSHEENGKAIPEFVFLGAEYIEVHYTLDKTMKGSDQSMSLDYEDIKNLLEILKSVEGKVSVKSRLVSDEENKIKKEYTVF